MRSTGIASAGETDGHVLIAMGPSGVATRILAAGLRNRGSMRRRYRAGQSRPALLSEFALVDPGDAPCTARREPIGTNFTVGQCRVCIPRSNGSTCNCMPPRRGFVEFAQAMGMRGASITPVKGACREKVQGPIRWRKRGARETLMSATGAGLARTRMRGFLAPLAGSTAIKGTRAAILGSGGAARAVAVALVGQGADVTVCARRHEAAREVARLSDANAGAWPPRPGSWDVLVNATSCGSRGPEDDPMAGVPLDGEIVFDLVYVPAETPLLKQARAEGCLTIGGLEMLVAQAERQFELWTGQRPPAGLFAAVAAAATGDRPRETQAEGSIR